MPYCKCDKCGYIADVPYPDADCPSCDKGKMREMTAEQELLETLRPLFEVMKKETGTLKQAVDELSNSITELRKTVEKLFEPK
jgi:hypothetical protein